MIVKSVRSFSSCLASEYQSMRGELPVDTASDIHLVGGLKILLEYLWKDDYHDFDERMRV